MAKRQATYRVPSESVQGEDSWVELKYMIWGNAQRAFKGEYTNDDMLTDHLVAWNWVDTEGEPLALSIDVLFEPERAFLLSALFIPPKAADSKN